MFAERRSNEFFAFFFIIFFCIQFRVASDSKGSGAKKNIIGRYRPSIWNLAAGHRTTDKKVEKRRKKSGH